MTRIEELNGYIKNAKGDIATFIKIRELASSLTDSLGIINIERLESEIKTYEEYIQLRKNEIKKEKKIEALRAQIEELERA